MGEAGGLAICIAVDESGKIFALGAKFSLKTGNVVGQWCPSGVGKLLGGLFEPVGVPTYPVKKTSNFVEVQVDVNYKANFEASYWKGILDAQGKSDGKYY